MRFPNKRVQVKTVPAKPLTDTELQAMYDYVRKIPNEEVLRTLYTTIANNAGGVHNMDPELVRAFADSFAKFQKNIPESFAKKSKGRNLIRLTEGQLKRIIREEYSRLKRRSLIKESSLPPMDRSMMRRLYDWIAINEEMGDPQDFLGTVDTFLEAESDAGMPLYGMEEEVHQALNDLIDLAIVSTPDQNNSQGLLIEEEPWNRVLNILDEIEEN